MTPYIIDFVNKNKDKLKGSVIEIGSLNVNGSLKEIIPTSIGVDMRGGDNVNLVCDVSDLFKYFKKRSFDVCISTDTLEHVKDWRKFIQNTWDVVKNDGYLIITMASIHKGKHAYPDDYWRMDEEMIKRIWPNCEIAYLGKEGKNPTSIGWIVKKEGDLGDLDFEPYTVG